MEKNYLHNPGMLKVDLMLRGIRIDGTASDEIKPFYGRSGKGIDLILKKGMLVNVPCEEEYTVSSPYLLKKTKKAWVITSKRGEAKVGVVSPPGFLKKKTSTGVPFSDIATVHGSYVVITPSPRCEFFDTNVECRYCAGNFDGKRERVFSVEEVLETVDAVLKEAIAGIIYLSIGFGNGEDGGIEFLSPYVKAIKKHFNCLVAVEALPPKKNHWIDSTYAIGADSVLYNLEIFDKELFELICPGRAQSIGRQRYVEALSYAATVFPSGTVASHLIVGLEPPGSTCMGVDFLTGMGVVPILPIYRPKKDMALRIEPLTAEIIIPIYKYLYTAVKKNNINMNWVRDISMVTTPIEGRLIAGEGGRVVDALTELFHRSGLGLKAAWGLSTLRRKLRVKGERDSPL